MTTSRSPCDAVINRKGNENRNGNGNARTDRYNEANKQRSKRTLWSRARVVNAQQRQASRQRTLPRGNFVSYPSFELDADRLGGLSHYVTRPSRSIGTPCAFRPDDVMGKFRWRQNLAKATFRTLFSDLVRLVFIDPNMSNEQSHSNEPSGPPEIH